METDLIHTVSSQKTPILERDTRLYQLFGETHKRVNDAGVLDYLKVTTKQRHNVDRYSVASDMDGSMYKSDLGTALFCTHALDPSFWANDNYHFEGALKSKDFIAGYKRALKPSQNGASIGQETDEIYVSDHQALAHWVLESFVPEIVKLYNGIKLHAKFFGIEEERERIRQFVAYMYILNQITMKIERVLNTEKSGKIIPQTRLLAGWTEGEIARVAEPIFDMDQDDPGRELNFRNLDLSFIQQAPGLNIAESFIETPLELRAQKVRSIKRFCNKVITSEAGLGNVITTNLPLTAVIAISRRPYKKMFDEQTRQTGVSRHHFVHGSRLVTSNGRVLPELEGTAILGRQKLDRARILNRTFPVMVGIGDSPVTDGLMMQASLDNWGIAIAVGRTREETQHRFSRIFAGLNDHARSRVLFAEQNSRYTDQSPE